MTDLHDSVPKPEQPKRSVIEVRDLYKIYRLGETKVFALNGVSFDIYLGEFCAIVGTSGSGKSTLLNMLAGLEPASKGTVKIRGKSIGRMPEEDLVRFRRDHVGFIFQSFNLIGTMSAVENVSLPLIFRGISKAEREKRAADFLIQLGLEKHLRHRPNQMSGGQQQRVGIARALVVDPDIIFADEPTGNLDSRTTEEIMRLIQKISREKNQTLIMVTHDDHLARYADRIFRIKDGKIISIEEGDMRQHEATAPNLDEVASRRPKIAETTSPEARNE